MTDSLGNEITPGCYLAYATRRGSCFAALRIGKVLGLSSKPHPYSYLEDPVISILIVTDRGHVGTNLVRKTTLSLPERSVVLHSDTIPADVKALLG
jgi:hypothetical protein